MARTVFPSGTATFAEFEALLAKAVGRQLKGMVRASPGDGSSSDSLAWCTFDLPSALLVRMPRPFLCAPPPNRLCTAVPHGASGPRPRW